MTSSAPDLVAASRALAAGGTFRAVRRARLLLPDREAEFQTRAALEDALRTADFCDAGRLIVVRTLVLKGLPRGATGPQIARALESAWRTLAPSAVAFDAPGAETAELVYFRSVHAARLGWLQRFARGDEPAEWFWSRAVPELADRHGAAALVPLLEALEAAAPQTLAEAVAEFAPSALRRLVSALPAVRVEALLAPAVAPAAAQATARARRPERTEPGHIGALQPTTPPAPRGEPDQGRSMSRSEAERLSLDPGLRERFETLSSALAASDWRLSWFAALVLRADTGEVPGAEAVVALIDAAAEARPATVAAVSGSAASPSLSPPRDRAFAPTASTAPAASSRPDVATARVQGGLPARPRRDAPDRRRLGSRFPWLEDSELTGFGGLLMLLNALEVLHFPEWLAPQSTPVRAHFGRALLSCIARRLRVPPDDPQQRVLSLDGGARRPLRDASCRWEGFRWPRGFDARGIPPETSAPAFEESLRRWQRALVRLLRRHAGVGLAHVVRRAAGVSITSTHVDIVLPLADADTALRRAGLDRDPGWVPWFGWIVAFHYLEEGRDAAG